MLPASSKRSARALLAEENTTACQSSSCVFLFYSDHSCVASVHQGLCFNNNRLATFQQYTIIAADLAAKVSAMSCKG
jgi:hypothetical protein